jgi:oligopeptide transport system permease protein
MRRFVHLASLGTRALQGCLVQEVLEQQPRHTFADALALQRDYTLVMGVVIVYAALIIVFNMLADVMYGVLDPRARKAA